RYASPEQLRGERITTASDLYSLGILLYELVAGRPPWPSQTAPSALLELRSADLPTAPSETLAGKTADFVLEAQRIAEERGTHPKALRRRLAGDLDAIVLKALAPEPERRYGSVELLQEDLRRFLRGFPVAARPAGWSHRTRRFLGRHPRFATVTAGLAFLVLTLGGLAGYQSLRLAAERDEALAARQRSEEMVGFLQDVFRVALEGEELTVRQAVSRSAASLDSKLLDQPRVRADLLEVIGNIYRYLGVYDEAERQLAKAVTIRRELFGDEDVSLARALGALGSAQAWQNRLDEGEEQARRALAIVGRQGNADARTEAALLNELVGLLCLRGDFAGAEEPSMRAMALASKSLGDRAVEKAQALASRARVLTGTGRNREALALYREAVRLQR
ncbi:MAG: tetratricopeptide repeat protein, partial [Acidobacteria bacterium]|nr:tetratricopeptide repeat protein [Acidobacteriota bacterium]